MGHPIKSSGLNPSTVGLGPMIQPGPYRTTGTDTDFSVKFNCFFKGCSRQEVSTGQHEYLGKGRGFAAKKAASFPLISVKMRKLWDRAHILNGNSF